MSKTPRPTTDSLRRLLDFIDAYAAEHPEFAAELKAALQAPPKAKPQPLRNPVDLYLQEGEAALDGYLTEQAPSDLVKLGKGLGLRLSARSGADNARQRIKERVQMELNRGAAFSREGPLT